MATETDLVEFTLAEGYSGDTSGDVGGGTWTFFGGAGGTGAGVGVDFAMQGQNAIDGKVSSNEKGPVIELNNPQTIPAGDHIFVWGLCATVGIAELRSNRGMCVFIGDATNNNYVQYHVNGNDTLNATGRLGQCYPVDYSVRTALAGRRTVSGNPSASPAFFGFTANITGSSKGPNVVCDAIRRGTGIFQFNGSTIVPVTFQESASLNDLSVNRWGIFQSLGGTSYLMQGRYTIGTNSAGVAQTTVFEDTGAAITLTDCIHASLDFTSFSIKGLNTSVTWNQVSVTHEGSTRRGNFNVLDGATVNLNGCTFTRMRAFSFGTGTEAVTLNGCSFTTCNSVELDANTIVDNCQFDNAPLTLADPENVTNCKFISRGSNAHGVIGFDTAGSYDFSTNTFEDFGTGLNAAIRVLATSGTVFINVSDQSYTVLSSGATVILVSQQVTTTITVRDVNTQSVIQNARVYLTAAAGGSLAEGTVIINAVTDVNGQVSDQRSFDSDQPVTGYVRKASSSPFYQNAPITGTISSTNGLALTSLMIPDE